MEVLSTIEREWLYPRFTLRVGLNRVAPSPLLLKKLEALRAQGLVSFDDEKTEATAAPAKGPVAPEPARIEAPESEQLALPTEEPAVATATEEEAPEPESSAHGAAEVVAAPVPTATPFASHPNSGNHRVKRRRR